MRKLGLFGLLVGLLALVVSAGASAHMVNSGSDCNYARPGSQAVSAGAEVSGTAQVFVYEGTGSTGNAGTTSAGVCGNVTGKGGFVEAGNGAPGTYIVADGSNGNPAPANGYAGLSNYEDGTADPTPCNGNDNDGDPNSTNGGGCFGLKPTNTNIPLPTTVPTPICGDTSGPNWNATPRDGCFIP